MTEDIRAPRLYKVEPDACGSHPCGMPKADHDGCDNTDTRIVWREAEYGKALGSELSEVHLVHSESEYEAPQNEYKIVGEVRTDLTMHGREI